jgi:hypothetical protein
MSRMRGPITTPALALAILITACAGGSPAASPAETAVTPPAAFWPDPPPVPEGELEPGVADAIDDVLSGLVRGAVDEEALTAVATSGDARLAWLIADMLRFVQGGAGERALLAAFTELTGSDPLSDERFGGAAWRAVTNLLIGWDLPAPPDYRERKARLFLSVEPAWAPFFDDIGADVDWRIVSWGGVFIDDRAIGDRRPCSRSCIPALDDPRLVAAEDGDWYDDDRIVFGIAVNGEAVAFPKHIMEVHEMVNLTVGGRRIGLPYCTLCGSAQAYLTDAVPDGIETPILRTSGLLSRSNKVMYDLVTGSLFNTFTGRAVSGPLRDAGVVLEQTTVTVSTWGEWRAAHPGTRIVAPDGGIGRRYPDDPLGGRDDDGPIFPIGLPDPRLPAQMPVVGVVGPDGRPVAFPAELAAAELAAGRSVSLDDVELFTDGAGLRARLRGGETVPAHESFWFAWSQFHPDTALWAPLGG